MPFGLYVDGKDDAERGELVLFIGDFKLVAVLKRGPRLFDARAISLSPCVMEKSRLMKLPATSHASESIE